MPPRTAAAAAAPNVEDTEQPSWIRQGIKYLALYWAVTSGTSFLLGPSSPLQAWIGKNAPGPSSGGDPNKEVKVPSAADKPDQLEAVPLWPAGAEMTLRVYLSTTGSIEDNEVLGLPSHTFEPVKYGEWDWHQSWETEFDLPASVQQNGTLYAVSVLESESPLSNGARKQHVTTAPHSQALISRYMPQRKVRAVKNLLSGGEEAEDSEEEDEEDLEQVGQGGVAGLLGKKESPIVSYYHPNLTLAIVNDPGAVLNPAALPPPIAQPFTFFSPKPNPIFEDKPHRWAYFPPVYQHDFWLLKEHMNPLNDTVSRVPLRIDVQPLSMMKMQIFASLEHSFKEAAAKGQPTGDMDEVKRMFTETSPWLLGTTVIVSILHMIFEFVAFSSDVSHWRKKQDVIGVSVRTILTNVAVQLIILLYLFDNNENTSWMILGSQGVGLLIEAWKITKAVDIKIVPSSGLLPYWFEVHDKHVLSEEELKTQQYDKEAFKVVSYGTIPLLIGYTIYSLLYESHRGWYSFVISTLTSFVYMFGFVQLIPQLIINYHLKSVAHMPVKSLIFKTLTTVVDDFFSFCIKMPTLHRLACFRDDVVFVILMYQYWIYRVDPKRANEYGQVAVDEDEPATEGEKKKLESKKSK